MHVVREELWDELGVNQTRRQGAARCLCIARDARREERDAFCSPGSTLAPGANPGREPKLHHGGGASPGSSTAPKPALSQPSQPSVDSR